MRIYRNLDIVESLGSGIPASFAPTAKIVSNSPTTLSGLLSLRVYKLTLHTVQKVDQKVDQKIP